MPISANRYIMKSHVNLDEPGVAFTLPHFPLNPAFLGENDPSLGYCCNAEGQDGQEVDAADTYFDAAEDPTVLLNGADVAGLER